MVYTLARQNVLIFKHRLFPYTIGKEFFLFLIRKGEICLPVYLTEIEKSDLFNSPDLVSYLPQNFIGLYLAEPEELKDRLSTDYILDYETDKRYIEYRTFVNKFVQSDISVLQYIFADKHKRLNTSFPHRDYILELRRFAYREDVVETIRNLAIRNLTNFLYKPENVWYPKVCLIRGYFYAGVLNRLKEFGEFSFDITRNTHRFLIEEIKHGHYDTHETGKLFEAIKTMDFFNLTFADEPFERERFMI